MVFECPECGTRQRGGTPGRVVACTSCRNPVVVPEAQPPAKEPPPAPHATEPRASVPGRLWGTAALVLVIVAAAHAGLYLLLTQEARSAIRTIELRPAEQLRTATAPEAAPQPGTPEYAPWREQVELWDDVRALRDHRKHVSLLRTGFFASFLVQVGITAWILLKLLAGQRAASRRRT